MTNINTFQGDVFIHEYIKHTGDDNNLFGFSGTDTFKIATAGADRLTINSAGNVGIGTNAPTTALEISRTFTANDDTSAMISFQNPQTGYHEWRIGPTIFAGSAAFSIKGGADGFGNLSDVIAIKGTSVGIGTNAPIGLLDVNGSTYIRGSMKADNFFSYYFTTPGINYAGNYDINTTSSFVLASTGATGTMPTGWYLYSIQRADANPFERAFGYFYKYIAGTNMSASGGMDVTSLYGAGIYGAANGNNFRLVTSSNAVSYPTSYAIRIVRLGLGYANSI